ncbi:MAG: FHA domain-containing protein [Deltaproteobacteria bacterium]
MVPTQNSSASAEITVSDPSSLTLPVHLVLEVTKGFTRFPRRPVTHPRFLIGAGSTCDLRLGGEGMPALHSLITVSGRDITLEAIAAEPPLKVNGRHVQTALLHDGDVIDVGEVELLARFEAGQTPAGAQMISAPPSAPVDADRPVPELSAAELVDLIEQEEKQIEDFETRQREGATALVQAILGRNRRPAARPAEAGIRAPIPAPHFLSKRPQILAAQTRQTQLAAEHDPALQQEIEELGRQLSTLAHELMGSTQRAAEREATYAEAADTLLDTQDKLVSQLEVLLDQVQTLKASEAPTSKPRAIA